MRAAAVLGTLALLMPSMLGAGAPAEPATMRDLLLRDLAAAGQGVEAVPDPVAWRWVDLATGAVGVQEEPRAAFLERLAAMPVPAPGHGVGAEGPSHRVVGDVTHSCYDGIRADCYKFYTNAAGPGQPLRVRDLEDEYLTVRAAYDATVVKGLVAMPVHGATVMYVQGVYTTGAHRAANVNLLTTPAHPNAGLSIEDGSPGSGTAHPDRAILGAGVGRVFLINISWGVGLFISIGQMRAHGAWTFCDAETHPDCASP